MVHINRQLLQSYIKDGLLTERKHPTLDLYIYNYTAICQYRSKWDAITLMCRGLVVDEAGTIIARPFPKFFNLEEHKPGEIPHEPFTIYEKLDGSLGILVQYQEQPPFLVTRGTFNSIQAQRGNQILNRSPWNQHLDQLDPALTYLFEIIYPENRIVVDYGGEEKLVLLAVRVTETGEYLPLEDFASLGFPLPKRYDGIQDYHQVRELLEEDNSEGYIIRFEGGMRVKIKLAEYVRLHRLLTGLNKRHIWDYLRTGQSFDKVLERVPDEFYAWVSEAERELRGAYEEIEEQCLREFRDDFATRKEAALYFKTCGYPSVLFKMLDEKPYHEVIWKLVKPANATPFRGAD